jgi:NADPH2:quinone reductase
MKVALAQRLTGIGSVELGELPDPALAAGQVLIRVHGAGVGPWDVGFLGGGFPGIALPFVPGQEVAGVVEAAGDGAGVQPGERVYAVLFPAVPGSPNWRWRRRPRGPDARPGELRRGGRAGNRRRYRA